MINRKGVSSNSRKHTKIGSSDHRLPLFESGEEYKTASQNAHRCQLLSSASGFFNSRNLIAIKPALPLGSRNPSVAIRQKNRQSTAQNVNGTKTRPFSRRICSQKRHRTACSLCIPCLILQILDMHRCKDDTAGDGSPLEPVDVEYHSSTRHKLQRALVVRGKYHGNDAIYALSGLQYLRRG